MMLSAKHLIKLAQNYNLGFPGGPIIDKIYKNYKGEFIKFTEPNAPGKFNFSFSGLKSQVINYYHNKLQRNEKADVDQIASKLSRLRSKLLNKSNQKSSFEIRC